MMFDKFKGDDCAYLLILNRIHKELKISFDVRSEFVRGSESRVKSGDLYSFNNG